MAAKTNSCAFSLLGLVATRPNDSFTQSALAPENKLYQLRGVAKTLSDPHEHAQSCVLSVPAAGKQLSALSRCVASLALCAAYFPPRVASIKETYKEQVTSRSYTNQGVTVPDQNSHVFFYRGVGDCRTKPQQCGGGSDY